MKLRESGVATHVYRGVWLRRARLIAYRVSSVHGDVIIRSSRAEIVFRSSDPAAGGWNLGTRLETFVTGI